MTLQQQAIQAVQILPESKLPSLIQFARFLKDTPDKITEEIASAPNRKFGRLKGKIRMADDFNETPAEFKEYI
ncbi:MAG: DUF2281 domain-containing protein [Lachnospiraceae bacterium]|nr:DUF2281 domain-containing protein [Lachnospiraceae bacterium]